MNGQKLFQLIFIVNSLRKPFKAKKTRFNLAFKLTYVAVGHKYANRTPQAISTNKNSNFCKNIFFHKLRLRLFGLYQVFARCGTATRSQI